MKLNLPIIGEIRTGKDAQQDIVEVIKEVQKKAKSVTGGFLDFSTKELVDETQVSSKVLEANKGWVYRNNDVIAKEVANIEFELYKVRTVRDEVVYDRIYSHPLLDALDKFNEFTSSYDGFYTTQSHRKLAGDAFWYVERTGLQINNIFILPPDKVTINLGKAEGSQRIIQGYTYKDTIKGEPVEIKYAPDEIVHFRVPDPKNFYRGKSAVMAAAEAIDTDTMAIEANKKLFERGLIAQLMLTTDKSLTDEQLKQLHSEFRNTYGGVENAYKVPIFGGGIKPENVQMSNKDAQFLEQQQWLRDKIMVIFGNTKAVLGITEDVNRANAEASLLSWMRSTVRPDMKGICDTLNEFLVPLYGDNLLLGFCDPVQEDETDHINEVKSLVDANIITVNEAREDLGYDPIKGGDELRSEAQVIPPALRYVNTNRVVRKYQAKANEYKRLKELARPIATKMIKSKNVPEKFVPRVLPEKMANYTKRHRTIVETAEAIFADKVVSFINRLVDKALENVPNEVTDMQKKELFDNDQMIVEATLDFEPILTQVATQSGIEAIKLVNEEHIFKPANMQKAVKERVEKFAKSMIETDKDKLIDIITDGVRGGSSIPEISTRIRDTFADYSKTQSDRIVRTEVANAASTAQIDAWKQTGVVEGKEWITSDPCPECEPYDGEVVGLDKNFYSASEFAEGDPPLHPNCKCAIVPVIDMERSASADIKVKRLEDKLENTVDKSDLEKVKAELDKAKKAEAKLKRQNKKLEQEKSELESFLDES
jgi:HK97 family phage portal protein